MINWIYATLFLMLGFMIYLAVPVLGSALPARLRYTLGKPYLKNASRTLGQFSFLERDTSGYDVKQIKIDQEQKKLKLQLSSPLLGSDVEFPFRDHDNQIKRLFKKPVALNYELIPAAVSAELADLGHWLREHNTEQGLVNGATVNPYVRVKDTMRVVRPSDAFELVSSGVEPENIKTAENLTRHRYSKYGGRVSMTEAASVISGFIVGIIGVAGFQYVMDQVMSGGTDPGQTMPILVGLLL